MPDQGAGQSKFRVEEATIAELHQAIRDGRTTCVDVVKQYIARVKAYNGVASLLVTEDGKPIQQANGTTRGGAPLPFPPRRSKPPTSSQTSTATRARPSSSAAWRRPRPIRRCSSSTA